MSHVTATPIEGPHSTITGYHAAVVVGGGPAGLATAAALRRSDVSAVVLERADAVGETWRRGYDRLRLNTSRLTSQLGGMGYERGTPLFPSRDDFVAYLERYAHRHRLDVRVGVEVQRIDRDDAAWRVETSAGNVLGEQVIVATGYAHEPYVPVWARCERFEGQLLHAADYRNADSFRDSDVLVVGAGCSGMEIAYDLAEGDARRVWLSVRTPPNILLRTLGHIPGDPMAVALMKLPPWLADAQMQAMSRLVIGDLRRYGLPPSEEGPFARLARTGTGPAVVDKEVIEAIKQGRVEIVAGVEALDRSGARLANGARIEPDAIIAATGYRCGLERLVGHLGVLDERGAPRVVGGREAAPGLRFIGFVPVPGQIRQVSIEAKRAARDITCRVAAPTPDPSA